MVDCWLDLAFSRLRVNLGAAPQHESSTQLYVVDSEEIFSCEKALLAKERWLSLSSKHEHANLDCL